MSSIKVYSEFVNRYLPGLIPFDPVESEDGCTQLTWEDKDNTIRFSIHLEKSFEDSIWGLVTKKELGRIMLSGSLNIDNLREILEWVSQCPNLPIKREG